MSYSNKIKTKTGKEIILRGMNGDDVEELRRYINQLIEEDTFIAQTEKKTFKEEEEYVKKRIKANKDKKGINVLAEYHGEIIANGEVTQKGERSKHVGLLGISVARGFRNEGLGTIIMEEMLKLSKEYLGLKIVYLTAFSINERALHVYKNKLGFEECGKIPRGVLYKNQLVDHLFLYKEL